MTHDSLCPHAGHVRFADWFRIKREDCRLCERLDMARAEARADEREQAVERFRDVAADTSLANWQETSIVIAAIRDEK